MFYVYFLKSLKNNKFYTGYTDKNPQTRLVEHNNGSNKWTKENGLFILVYYEKYYCKKDAMEREKFYKNGFGREIRNAIIRTVSAKGGPALGWG